VDPAATNHAAANPDRSDELGIATHEHIIADYSSHFLNLS
jgi:hypothetical protein